MPEVIFIWNMTSGKIQDGCWRWEVCTPYTSWWSGGWLCRISQLWGQDIFARKLCMNKKYFRLWPIYYSSRIVFSHIPIEFGPTRNGAVRSDDPENPTLEPNMNWIERPLADIWPFVFFPFERSVVGWSVVSIPVGLFLHWSHILLFATLGT